MFASICVADLEEALGGHRCRPARREICHTTPAAVTPLRRCQCRYHRHNSLWYHRRTCASGHWQTASIGMATWSSFQRPAIALAYAAALVPPVPSVAAWSESCVVCATPEACANGCLLNLPLAAQPNLNRITTTMMTRNATLIMVASQGCCLSAFVSS